MQTVRRYTLGVCIWGGCYQYSVSMTRESKARQIASFDPNSPGDPNSSTLYGLPFLPEDAEVVVVPVPWDVTVSYKDGAALGPEAILAASVQVDLFDPAVPSVTSTPSPRAPIR